MSHGRFIFSEERTFFKEIFSCFVGISLTLKKVNKKTRQLMKPKMIISILKPFAWFPSPNAATNRNAVALTTVAPRKAKNFLVVDNAVRSSVSAVKLGKMDAIGTLTIV